MNGTLYVVATPIGNLEDITYRAVETLKNVDVVACEDTRRTSQLLNHFSIRKPTTRYDEHSHHRSAKKIIADLRQGKSVAVVTDAGTPGVSDPGHRLVSLVVKEGFPVVPIPGPSSLATALSVSGFVSEGHVFLGFLPRKKGRAERLLREALGLGRTVLLFESPYRVGTTLELIEKIEPTLRVCIAREMTKKFEEFIRGDIHEVRLKLNQVPMKGEFVICISPEKD